MPPTHTDEGLRAAHRIRAEHPDTAVLVLSQYVEEAYALELLSESTERTGYLLKDRVADVDTFTDAVRRVAGGGSALDPEVVALLLGRRRREDPLEALTAREREVLGLMAEGRSNAAIAEALVVTERAVEKHVTSIFSKLDLTPDGRGPPPRARGARVPAGVSRRPRVSTASRYPGNEPSTPRVRRVDHSVAMSDTTSRPIVSTTELRRVYGEGETAVHALRGITVAFPERPVRRDHGPVRLGQVHADAPARGARPADRRARWWSTAPSSPTSTTRRSRACAATGSASSSRPSTSCRS